LKLEPDDTPMHDTRDHPPPQHISGDSAALPCPSSRRRARGGVSQLAAIRRILSSAAAADDDAGGRPGDRITI